MNQPERRPTDWTWPRVTATLGTLAILCATCLGAIWIHHA